MRGTASSGACSQRVRWAINASAKAIAKPIRIAGMTICRCCSVGVPKRSMFSFAQSKQKMWPASPWQGLPPSRSRKKPPPPSPAAMTSGLLMRPLHRRLLVDPRLRRGEELGDDLDREDAGDPTLAVDHRRILRLALQQVGECVAHHVV